MPLPGFELATFGTEGEHTYHSPTGLHLIELAGLNTCSQLLLLVIAALCKFPTFKCEQNAQLNDFTPPCCGSSIV